MVAERVPQGWRCTNHGVCSFDITFIEWIYCQQTLKIIYLYQPEFKEEGPFALWLKYCVVIIDKKGSVCIVENQNTHTQKIEDTELHFIEAKYRGTETDNLCLFIWLVGLCVVLQRGNITSEWIGLWCIKAKKKKRDGVLGEGGERCSCQWHDIWNAAPQRRGDHDVTWMSSLLSLP